MVVGEARLAARGPSRQDRSSRPSVAAQLARTKSAARPAASTYRGSRAPGRPRRTPRSPGRSTPRAPCRRWPAARARPAAANSTRRASVDGRAPARAGSTPSSPRPRRSGAGSTGRSSPPSCPRGGADAAVRRRRPRRRARRSSSPRPDEELPLDALASRRPARRRTRRPGGASRAGGSRASRSTTRGTARAPVTCQACDVQPGELGVVVEHLLEVRDVPRRVGRVAVEPAADLVVDPARGHRGRASSSPCSSALGLARAGARRRRNSSVIGWGNFGAPPNPPHPRRTPRAGLGERRAQERPRRAARRDAGSAGAAADRPRRPRRPWSVDLVAPVAPRLGHRLQDPPERRASRAGPRSGSTCRRRTARRRG